MSTPRSSLPGTPIPSVAGPAAAVPPTVVVRVPCAPKHCLRRLRDSCLSGSQQDPGAASVPPPHASRRFEMVGDGDGFALRRYDWRGFSGNRVFEGRIVADGAGSRVEGGMRGLSWDEWWKPRVTLMFFLCGSVAGAYLLGGSATVMSAIAGAWGALHLLGEAFTPTDAELERRLVAHLEVSVGASPKGPGGP